MENLNKAARPAGRPKRWALITLAAAFLVAAGILAAVQPGFKAAAQPPKTYEALRLLTDAFYEINTKYVKPKAEQEMVYGALRGMAASLDPDSSFLTPPEYRNWQAGPRASEAEAGMDLVVKDTLITALGVLEGGPAWKAGLRPGDHILKINGKPAHDLSTLQAMERFRGLAGTQIKLQVIRNNMIKPMDLTVTLGPLAVKSVSHQILPEDYAYIRIHYFDRHTAGALKALLRDLRQRTPPPKGIVLDLRNNARGAMDQAIQVGALFLGPKVVVRTKGRKPEGEQTLSGRAGQQVFARPVPMVVLVNDNTARAAEILAGALKDHQQGILLGAKTYGLAGVTRPFPLDDGSALVITVAHCYTPGGHKITGKGLEPEAAGEKAKAPETPAQPSAQPPAEPPSLEQDPWVKQAMEILKGGRPKSPARKS